MVAWRAVFVSTAVACGAPATAPHTAHEAPAVPAPVDTDRDGIADAEDACPRDPGAAATDPAKSGCPAPALVKASSPGDAFEVRVYFPRGGTALLAEALPTVDATVALLKARPDICQLRIEGHASSDEPDAQHASEARAKSVLDRMVSAGIDGARLVARGYGSSRPITEDARADGKQRSRRVEFHVLGSGSAPAPGETQPCTRPVPTNQ
jgi:OOP family OmpA-OmpF porin